MNKPLLSIASVTYNHEKFIAQAIESWLMQKTDFEIEIVIGEDCSTDNTRQIVDQYRQKYPNLIRLITSEHNVGMQANFMRTLDACRGKYIALCDGDDYWTDSSKLQKQVDFLEQHKEYSIVGHLSRVMVGNELKDEKYSVQNPVLIEDWIGLLPFRTNTFVFRKEVIENIVVDITDFISGDRIIMASALLQGKGHILNTYMSVYRIHNMGISKQMDIVNIKNDEIRLFKELKSATKNKYDKKLNINILFSFKYIIDYYWTHKMYFNWSFVVLKSFLHVRDNRTLKIFIKENLLRK